MQLKELCIWIFAFSLAVGIVNTLGFLPNVPGFESTEVTESDVRDTIGISDVTNLSVSSGSDLDSDWLGTSMLLNCLGQLWTIIKFIFVPYGYMKAMGFPDVMAGAVQAMFNMVAIWSIIQFVSNRSMKSID